MQKGCKMEIIKQAREALNILSENGYYAYVVGGCVRDSLLFSIPKDWDITTQATPNQILDCFLNYKTIETGLKYGTVTVIIDEISIEITTYRIDGEYRDNRHPLGVLFTDELKKDLSRRDFTMNAIAYNTEIVDYFCGVSDIKNKIIRTVGDPDKRFSEDALRILRGIRFASQLDFKIEENTGKSIIKNKGLLKSISRERINIELIKLLLGKNSYNVLIEYEEIIREIIPEIDSINRKMKSPENDIIISLALLLWETESPENILKNLKFDKNTINMVTKIIKNKHVKNQKVELKRLLNKLGEPIVRRLLKIEKHDERLLDEIIENKECYSLEALKLNGDDIKALGITDGKVVGEALNRILTLVIEEKIKNDREICVNYLKNLEISGKTIDF